MGGGQVGGGEEPLTGGGQMPANAPMLPPLMLPLVWATHSVQKCLPEFYIEGS